VFSPGGAERWQKENYGTVPVDLEARRVVDLMPDRTAQTLGVWAAH
jgi:hypothetical protein